MTAFALPDPDQGRTLLDSLLDREPTVSARRVDAPVVIYGAGKLGKMAAELFTRLGVDVAYAIDRAPPPGGLLDGRIRVLRPDEVPFADRATHLIAVSVVFAPYAEIAQQLASMGWRDVRPLYDIAEAYADRLPMRNGWFAGRLNERDAASIAGVFDRWHDAPSRAAYLQFLAWRIHRAEWTFDGAPVTTGDRYFTEFVRCRLRDDEHFLDAGAYHGEVIERFLATTGGRFGRVLAVEADPLNYAQLEARLSALAPDIRERIATHHCALADRAGELAFSDGFDLASRLDDRAATRVPALRLDDFDFPPSFAKIHVEGGELDVLRGGLTTIRQHRPMLAVTVYHNRDGLWKIPDLLMRELAGYAFSLRLHAWCGTGCVLYAIPDERLATRRPL